ncbi:MAG: beta-lactamase family protein [Holophagaceae bacterium]|nr:beta-lactamase family protein [Holophagaceae bacterium]
MRPLLFATLFIPALFAQAPATTAPETLAPEVRASAFLKAFRQEKGIPGLSIAVARGDRLVWREAFGFADLETKTPVTTETIFPIGSTSKALTSLALGQLVEQGKVDLDAPIQTYVKDFPAKGHPITVRMLASHQAGLRDYDMARGEYHNTRAFPSVKKAVKVFAQDPLRHEPGTKYAYSAYHFVLLSAAIEGASGQDFLTYMKAHIFAPLGLVSTGPDRGPAGTLGRVTCYTEGFLGLPARAEALDVSNKWAAGGFASTPSELATLGAAALAGKVVTRATFTLLTTPVALKDGRPSGAPYALGWRTWMQKLPSGREVRAVNHHGMAHGAQAFLVLFPEQGVTVSIQSNLLTSSYIDLQKAAFQVADYFIEVKTPAGTR